MLPACGVFPLNSMRQEYSDSLGRLGWLAIAVALLTRVAFLQSKPFWRDEAWVASLVRHPLRDAITFHLPVPIGFVAATKLAALLPVLPPEVSFRLLPLICGMAALPALYHLAYGASGSRPIALTALWIATGLPGLVYYSRELKSYSIDLLLSVTIPLLVMGLFGRSVRRKTTTNGKIIALLLALTAAPWFSFGSLFPIAATLVWGWLAYWNSGSRPIRRWWVVATLLYAASFGLAYLAVVHGQARQSDVLSFWESSFLLTHGVPTWGQLSRAMSEYFSVSLTYLFPWAWPLAVPLIVIGAIWWPGPLRVFVWWLCCGSAAATVTVALANYYPLIAGRLLLFAAPPYLLFASAGLMQVGRWLEPWVGGQLAQRLVLGVALASGICWSGVALLHRVEPYRNDSTQFFLYDTLHDVEPLIAYAVRAVPPGDPVLVSPYAGRPFRFYAGARLASATVLEEGEAHKVLAGFRRWLKTVRRRGWILLLQEEEEAFLGKPLEEAGFGRREAASTRGTLLWEISYPTFGNSLP
jgi:hypothetical protein